MKLQQEMEPGRHPLFRRNLIQTVAFPALPYFIRGEPRSTIDVEPPERFLNRERMPGFLRKRCGLMRYHACPPRECVSD